MLEVIQPGLLTIVQDTGRPRYISRGVSPAGAFDNFSFRIGNLLVGNQANGHFLIAEENVEAGLEMTLAGPKLKALDDLVIAITGADMSPMLDGEHIPLWKSIRLKKGNILSFGTTKQGVRSYLCVAGGIDVPLFLGSRSTFVSGKLGGIEGRGLKSGDKLKVKQPITPLETLEGRYFRQEVIPNFGNEWTLRVILGPQNHLFTEESVKIFLETKWKASNTMNRVGVRLIGPKLDFKPRSEYLVRVTGTDPSNIVPDTTPVGAVQVPGGVEPIIFGVEAPGSGGYTKIATVISAEVSLVGQIKPRDIVTFKAVTTEEAVDAIRQKEKLINEAYIVRQI